jgi:pyruvate/2-oxoglutarate dehydrogenase complex dihydrolipoamide acyltransferase (E2) component
MQMEQLELSAHLPRLDALDSEFGWKDERCAAARKRQGDAAMDSTLSPIQPELAAHLRAVRPGDDAITRLSLGPVRTRTSLCRRVSRSLARFLVIFCIGLGAALGWHSYGDAARTMIASSSPQLGWLAPQTAPVAQTTPDVPVPAAAATSPDLQQLALGLASVRRSVEQLAVQLGAGQQQLVGDIAKLNADEQEILHKLSAALPRPAPAAARKPAPVPPSPSPQAR